MKHTLIPSLLGLVAASTLVSCTPGERGALIGGALGAGTGALIGDETGALVGGAIGDVTVNDDLTDNIFREPIGRFAEIDEDVAPTHLLVSDYETFLA